MLAAAPCTPSARFSQDVTSGIKARAWVEEVIGRRLPEGEFGAAFKDGVGLCELVNVLQPGAITKIEKSASPFHQMANISSFLQACRALGVREQVLFETLVSKRTQSNSTPMHIRDTAADFGLSFLFSRFQLLSAALGCLSPIDWCGADHRLQPLSQIQQDK